MSSPPKHLSGPQVAPISDILEGYLQCAEQQEREIRSVISSLRESEVTPGPPLVESWAPGLQGSGPEMVWAELERRAASMVQEVRDACSVARGENIDMLVRDRIIQIKQHIQGEVQRDRDELLHLHAEVRELSQLRDYPLSVSRQHYAESKKEVCEQLVGELALLYEELESAA